MNRIVFQADHNCPHCSNAPAPQQTHLSKKRLVGSVIHVVCVNCRTVYGATVIDVIKESE